MRDAVFRLAVVADLGLSPGCAYIVCTGMASAEAARVDDTEAVASSGDGATCTRLNR